MPSLNWWKNCYCPHCNKEHRIETTSNDRVHNCVECEKIEQEWYKTRAQGGMGAVRDWLKNK